MAIDIQPISTEQLSRLIGEATGPAFLLGAVSGFVAVLMSRQNLVMDRIRTINAIDEAEDARLHLKADLPRLRRRATLLNEAIYLAVGAAICTTLLVIFGFGAAFFGLRHEPGAAIMFILALGLMCTSLFNLAREVRMALTEYDHYR
ncbi:MAG: DUF2721 domain-containing protein [Geminicoccaceae bacterium]